MNGISVLSVNEKYQRAVTLLEQLNKTAPKIAESGSLDSATYSGMRALRRQALSAHAELADLHKQKQMVQFEPGDGNKLFVPGVSASKPEHRSFEPLVKSFEQHVFVRDGGKAVLRARPPNYGIGNRMWQKTLDIVAGTMRYGAKHPGRAAAIGVGSLVAKLLFVYFCWEAVKKSADAVFGLHKKKAGEAATSKAPGPETKPPAPSRTQASAVAPVSTNAASQLNLQPSAPMAGNFSAGS